MINLGIDFAMGAGATLAVEFVLAHGWIWYQGGGSKTVSGTLTTIEADVKSVGSKAVTLEQKIVGGAKSVANVAVSDVKGGVGRTEQFFGSWFNHTNPAPVAAQTAPVAQTSPATQTAPVAQSAPVVAQTAPQTSGTPVPSVVLSH